MISNITIYKETDHMIVSLTTCRFQRPNALCKEDRWYDCLYNDLLSTDQGEIVLFNYRLVNCCSLVVQKQRRQRLFHSYPFLCHSYSIPIWFLSVYDRWKRVFRTAYEYYLIDLVLYTRTKVVLFLVLTRRSCFSLSSGSCLILEACSCPVAWVALSLFCLWDHCL